MTSDVGFQEYVILNGNKTHFFNTATLPLYYESNNADELAEWVYDNCLDVVNPVKVKEKAENYQK